MEPLEGCSDACGWIGALIAILGFGSFGIPIKSDRANQVDIDPLVMQTYKSTLCFLLSFTVLFVGVEFSFTPWGIVSGLFWVPGGTAVVYGIRNAGLALTVGVNSSLIVLVSFTWGIFIFDEHVRSRQVACLAVLLMILGIWGMVYFSQPHLQTPEINFSLMGSMESNNIKSLSEKEEIREDQILHSRNELAGSGSGKSELVQHHLSSNTDSLPYSGIPTHQMSWITANSEDLSTSEDEDENSREDLKVSSTTVLVCGNYWTRRSVGISCAVFNGLWGGSIMVPMHYAGSHTKGLDYVISFGIGALLVTIVLWILRYAYNLFQCKGNYIEAFSVLPSMYLKEMWLAGTVCGTLWQMANIGSIVSVQFLGEGVGYSVVQAALLVSGLWGIFWFKEIRGKQTIAFWISSALVTVLGVLLLSQEHMHGSG